jgi:hypothetical protein
VSEWWGSRSARSRLNSSSLHDAPIPDCGFFLETTAGPSECYLEWDRGTETLARLTDKLTRYWHAEIHFSRERGVVNVLSRNKLEAAVIHQLAALYRDGTLIRDALDAATAKAQQAQPALEEQRRALANESRRAERALARYYTAFENGELDATRFEKRVSSLATHLDALHEQDADLAEQRAPQAATSPDAAELAAVAENLETTIATADPRQAKALLRLLIKDLRVNARSQILPTYRIITPAVCALPSSVGGAGIEPATSCL